MTISMDEVRKRILIGLFSDDELLDSLVLKGGNALAMIYRVAGSRSSLDMDFSVADKFPDFEATRERIFQALKREFASVGYVVFDEKFEKRPSERKQDNPDWWGGYLVEFKLATRALFEKYHDDIDALRRNSEVLGPAHARKYTIDISQHEFCEEKVAKDVDDYTVYVYSLEMLAAEKLRAICQQMPEYKFGNKRPRARDFYDIHQILTEHSIDMTTHKNRATLAAVFEAKAVPLELLSAINQHKDYHAQDWPSVEASITGEHMDFDYYFNYVVDVASKLAPRG